MLRTLLGIAGLTTSSPKTIDLAYDVLGLEALFLVPRIFSLLSLNPYFGTLVCNYPTPINDSKGTALLDDSHSM